MLKVYMKLQALNDIQRTDYKKGYILEMYNDVFDKQCGIAYYPLDKDWEVIEYKVVEEENLYCISGLDDSKWYNSK